MIMNSQRNHHRRITVMKQVQKGHLVILLPQNEHGRLHQVDDSSPILPIPEIILFGIIALNVGVTCPDLPHLRIRARNQANEVRAVNQLVYVVHKYELLKTVRWTILHEFLQNDLDYEQVEA